MNGVRLHEKGLRGARRNGKKQQTERRASMIHGRYKIAHDSSHGAFIIGPREDQVNHLE